MRDDAARQFDSFARLADPAVNAALIERLDAQFGPRLAPRQLAMRANLARRGGDLARARADYAALAGGQLDPGVIVPSGLEPASGVTPSPLICIDGFLPREAMHALHRHACAIEDRFRPDIQRSAGEDPVRVDALYTHDFDAMREELRGMVAERLGDWQRQLGLPAFSTDKSQLRLTCQRGGSFLAAHADNTAPIGEAGRAITWLYYFGEDPPRRSGGDLLVLDTDFATGTHSASWLTRVEPRPNRLVAFPSWYHHAVTPTVMQSDDFAAARFAVAGHVTKPADGLGWRESDAPGAED